MPFRPASRPACRSASRSSVSYRAVSCLASRLIVSSHSIVPSCVSCLACRSCVSCLACRSCVSCCAVSCFLYAMRLVLCVVSRLTSHVRRLVLSISSRAISLCLVSPCVSVLACRPYLIVPLAGAWRAAPFLLAYRSQYKCRAMPYRAVPVPCRSPQSPYPQRDGGTRSKDETRTRRHRRIRKTSKRRDEKDEMSVASEERDEEQDEKREEGRDEKQDEGTRQISRRRNKKKRDAKTRRPTRDEGRDGKTG